MAISRLDRARQFLPFDALKGFQEALKEKEIEYVEKRELSEDSIEQLSKEISLLLKGDMIKIKYYTNKQYKYIEGTIKKVDSVKKSIILLGDTTIRFDDIIEIYRR